jgi:hypothetical protein
MVLGELKPDKWGSNVLDSHLGFCITSRCSLGAGASAAHGSVCSPD